MSKVAADECRKCCDDQKGIRLDISRYLLSLYEDDPGDSIEQAVTQDETWVHHFDTESKLQSKTMEAPWLTPS